MKKALDRNNIILNLLYFLMVFSLVYLVGIVIYLDLSFIKQIALALAITMGVRFIIKNAIVLYLSLIILFIGGLLVNSYITPIYPFFSRLFVLFDNIHEHIFMGELIASENILPFWVLLTIIYSIFTALVIFRPREESFSLLIIYLPLFIYYWYIYINQAYFALAIFLFSYFVLRGLISYRKEKSKVEPGLRKYFSNLSSPWSKTTLIYGILIIIIALILPKSDNSIRWVWMEDQISSIVPKIEEMRSTDSATRGTGQAGIFSLAQTGFQENPSQLGGPISPNNDTVMYVRADKPTYLRGAVRHFYNGSSWETSTMNSNITHHMLETNFSGIDYSQREEYYDERDVIVKFVDYASTTLFSPYMPIVVNAERGDQITVTGDHIMGLSEGVYSGESYGVKVLEPKPYYELLDSGIDNNYDNSNLYWEFYLQIPMSRLTQRTIDLKNEIIADVEVGRNTNYEKARAFESYLRENFDYTLDTSPVPADHEFIDYFLFEEQAGYCTYYATTMTIFLRLEGIPSRYVEGYIAHEPTENGLYEVRQSHAHAWVEAYIEPVGWITFEPTSAYPVDDRDPDLAEDIEEDTQEVDITPENDIESDMDISADDNMAMNGEEAGTESERESSISPRTMILIILGVMVLILPVRFLIRVIKYEINEYKIRKLPRDKKMLIIYDKILELIEKLGHPRKTGETHYEFANRIGYKFKDLREITNIFVRNKYGDTMPSEEEIKLFEDYRNVLEEQLKNNLGKIRYYIRKY